MVEDLIKESPSFPHNDTPPNIDLPDLPNGQLRAMIIYINEAGRKDSNLRLSVERSIIELRPASCFMDCQDCYNNPLRRFSVLGKPLQNLA